MFQIEENIREELFDFLSKNYPSKKVYIRTTGVGCAGPTFVLEEKGPEAGDICEVIEGFTFSAPARVSEKFGGYVFCKGYRGVRLKSVIKTIGECASCINTIEGHPCH